jgi:hypothetical protein
LRSFSRFKALLLCAKSRSRLGVGVAWRDGERLLLFDPLSVPDELLASSTSEQSGAE